MAVQRMVLLVVTVMIFLFLLPTFADVIDDASSIQTLNGESLGQANGSGFLNTTTNNDNVQTAIVYNDTVTLATPTDYNITLSTGRVVVQDAGGANANISVNYTYKADGYVEGSNNTRSLISILLLVFVVSVVVNIARSTNFI